MKVPLIPDRPEALAIVFAVLIIILVIAGVLLSGYGDCC